jgi:hypothetical protein
MQRRFAATVRNALMLGVLIALTGLHSKGKNKKRRKPPDPPVGGAMKKNKEDAESSEYRPRTGTDPSKPKPKKPKPRFKASKKAVDHAWDDHKPGSQYDKDGKDQNIWHDTKMSRERLEKLLAEAQEQGKGVETPRNPTDPRAGKYIDYNTHDENNPTGRNGQTGIRIVVDGDGNMVTAFPYPHVDGN